MRQMASRNHNSYPYGAQARRHHHRHRRHERAEHGSLRSRLWRRVSFGPRSYLPLLLSQCALRWQGRVHQQSRAPALTGDSARPQAHFALESLADEAAEKLHLDPLEFRQRNHVGPEGQPGERTTPLESFVPAQPIEGGIPFSSNLLAECLDEGAKRIGWKPRPGGPRRLEAAGKFRGMGVACCIYKTGQSQSSAI